MIPVDGGHDSNVFDGLSCVPRTNIFCDFDQSTLAKTEFFDKISKKLNTMQDGQDMQDSMITKPNPQAFVFVRFFIKKQCHQVFGYIDIEIKEDAIYYLPFE